MEFHKTQLKKRKKKENLPNVCWFPNKARFLVLLLFIRLVWVSHFFVCNAQPFKHIFLGIKVSKNILKEGVCTGKLVDTTDLKTKTVPAPYWEHMR